MVGEAGRRIGVSACGRVGVRAWQIRPPDRWGEKLGAPIVWLAVKTVSRRFWAAPWTMAALSGTNPGCCRRFGRL